MQTRSLNLDGMFQPTTFPEIEFNLLVFSGGELHIKLNKRIDYGRVEKVVITQRANNSNAIMAILIAVDALKRLGIKRFDLIMPYIPYARQDRYEIDENLGESFTLDVFTNIINSVGFETIHTLDAHSDISKVLIKNNCDKSNHQFVVNAINDSRRVETVTEVGTLSYNSREPIWIISPDSGANKKSNKLITKLLQDTRNLDSDLIKGLIKCDKKRDIATGQLSGFEVFSEDLMGFDAIIVDDICDGGGTFNGLAQELEKKNAGDLYLFVSHGIFSQGYDKLSDNFRRIFTTNSVKDIVHPIVKQYKIEY